MVSDVDHLGTHLAGEDLPMSFQHVGRVDTCQHGMSNDFPELLSSVVDSLQHKVARREVFKRYSREIQDRERKKEREKEFKTEER